MQNIPKEKVFEKLGKLNIIILHFWYRLLHVHFLLILQTFLKGKGFFGKLREINDYNSVFLIYCMYTSP